MIKYLLNIYHPTRFLEQHHTPMPVPLTKSEYWYLTSVEGLDTTFRTMDAVETTDYASQLEMQQGAELREMAFTLTLDSQHIDDALTFAGRYFTPGVNAVLVDCSTGAFMPCVIKNYEFNRYSKSTEITLNLQPTDRYWHVGARQTITYGTANYNNGDVTVPVKVVDYKTYRATWATAAPTQAYVTYTHDDTVIDPYTGDTETATTSKYILFDVSAANISAPRVDGFDRYVELRLTLDFAKGQALFAWRSNGADRWSEIDITGAIKTQYTNWFLTTPPSNNDKITVQYDRINPTIDTGIEITTYPLFETQPVDGTPATITDYAPSVIPGNIRKGVVVDGIEGSYDGESPETYDGPYTVYGGVDEQTLETAGKVATDNIVISAVTTSTSDDLVVDWDYRSVGDITREPLTDVNKYKHVRGMLKRGGYMPAQTECEEAYRFYIPDSEAAKIIPSNIRKGVNILEVTGDIQSIDTITYPTGALYPLHQIITYLDASQLDISSLTTLYGLFRSSRGGHQMSALQKLVLPAIGTNITSLESAFGEVGQQSGSASDKNYPLDALKEIIITQEFNLANVTSMQYMCQGCAALEKFDFPDGCDVAKVTSLRQMFMYCTSLKSVSMRNLNFASLAGNYGYEGGYNIFTGCTALTTIDMSGTTMPAITGLKRAFKQCYALTTVTWPDNFCAGFTSGAQLVLSDCPLSAASLTDLVNKLASHTYNCTLALSATCQALLTDAQKATLTAKKWTLST